MKNIFIWIAGFFEDQKGGQSSKRVAMYWLLGLLTYMVIKGANSMEMFWGVLGGILVFGGYSTSEFFKSIPKSSKDEK